MKHFFLIAIILLAAKIAFGQAPVIDSTWLPKVGDKYYVYNLTGETPIDYPLVPANDTGANVTWDFNSIFYINTYRSDSFDFVLPSKRSIPCSNPSANFASGNSTVYNCYVKNSDGLFIADNKIYEKGFGYLVDYYTKPEVFMKSNLKFREKFSDTSKHYYYFVTGHSQTDSNSHQIMKRSLVYDGYGTLKVAGKIFDSAVRVRETTFQIDSQYSGGTYYKAYTLISIYKWYVPYIHAPLLNVYRAWDANSSGDTLSAYGGLTKLSLPINMSPSAVPLSPIFNNTTANMAEGYIEVHNTKGSEISYSVYNSGGRLIVSGRPNTGGINWQIPVSNLSTGVYILKLQNDYGDATSIKLVKDH